MKQIHFLVAKNSDNVMWMTSFIAGMNLMTMKTMYLEIMNLTIMESGYICFCRLLKVKRAHICVNDVRIFQRLKPYVMCFTI